MNVIEKNNVYLGMNKMGLFKTVLITITSIFCLKKSEKRMEHLSKATKELQNEVNNSLRVARLNHEHIWFLRDELNRNNKEIK
jgi:hypothetical protein